MMVHKQLLHELLKEDQEPFHLQTYIADRRSSHVLKKPSPTTVLQLKKRKLAVNEIYQNNSNLRRHACFFSFQSSPDVRKSPFIDFQSPAKSPSKSPCNSVFLHIPPRTADLLLEAAMRIQRQQLPKPKFETKRVGFGLFGSFLKRLKDRSKNKKRAIVDVLELGKDVQNFECIAEEAAVRISCSCSNPRLSSADWTESNEDNKSVEESSCCGSECSENINAGLRETRFCSSPFRFSPRRSPSASGRRTPDFCSPATSPSRHIKQEKEKFESNNSDNVRGEEEEEKEQCSPVSILDAPFEEEDDEHESRHSEEDDCDLECSYANVERAKQQLLYRLRRFEKLAELDPIELERKLLEESGDEDEVEGEEFQNDDPTTPHGKHTAEAFVTEVLDQSSLQKDFRKMSTDMRRLVSDLIFEEKSEIVYSGNREVMLGRICNRLDSWKEVEFDTIDMMIELDFKKDCDGWMKFAEQVEEAAAEIEVAIYGLLLDELSEEVLCMDGHQQLNCEYVECT